VPKVIEYPRSSLKRAVELAEAVDQLGGECSDQSAADHIGNKVGGAFNALVGAAIKFGLISASKGRLKIEPLFSDYKLAYTEADKQTALRKAFLSAPLFASITKRFEGQQLPAHFEKLLIREHKVSEDFASRIVGYYTEGAKESGIIDANGRVNSNPQAGPTGPGPDDKQPYKGPLPIESEPKTPLELAPSTVLGYTVRITGPGIDATVQIKDEEDLEIVEITLKKVKRLITAKDPLMQ
jgi:hypothetical protein